MLASVLLLPYPGQSCHPLWAGAAREEEGGHGKCVTTDQHLPGWNRHGSCIRDPWRPWHKSHPAGEEISNHMSKEMSREAAPLLLAVRLFGRGSREAFTRVGCDEEGPQSALPYPSYRPGHREAVAEGIGAGRGFPSSVMGHQASPGRGRAQVSGQDYHSRRDRDADTPTQAALDCLARPPLQLPTGLTCQSPPASSTQRPRLDSQDAKGKGGWNYPSVVRGRFDVPDPATAVVSPQSGGVSGRWADRGSRGRVAGTAKLPSSCSQELLGVIMPADGRLLCHHSRSPQHPVVLLTCIRTHQHYQSHRLPRWSSGKLAT